LLDEAYRHAKVIGAAGDGRAALEAGGYVDLPGVVVDDDGGAVVGRMLDLMSEHRVWQRLLPTA
jgi:catalase